MSEPFLAEVRIVGFNFAPRGWAFCDGQILPINTKTNPCIPYWEQPTAATVVPVLLYPIYVAALVFTWVPATVLSIYWDLKVVKRRMP